MLGVGKPYISAVGPVGQFSKKIPASWVAGGQGRQGRCNVYTHSKNTGNVLPTSERLIPEICKSFILFLSRVSILTHNIDIAILSVCPSVTFRY